MIVQMQAGISKNDGRVKEVSLAAKEHGLVPEVGEVQGTECAIVEIYLKNGAVKTSALSEHIFMLTGVDSVRRVNQRLPVSDTVYLGPSLLIGKGNPCALVAGPCTVDEHIFTITRHLADYDVKALRGGCWKPRSNPHSFRGFGRQGVFWLLKAAKDYRMEAVFTEVMESRHVEAVSRIKKEVGYKGTVVLWVGARTENTILLSALGAQSEFPVMLKNSVWAEDVKNLTDKAQWVLAGWNQDRKPSILHGFPGNNKIIFCLRGTKRGAHSSHYRYDPNHHWANDLRDTCDAPIAIDPSHSAGTMKKDLVLINCRKALIERPNILMVETGYPEKGFGNKGFRGHCDVDQCVSQERFPEVVNMVEEHNRAYAT